jgi:hypothetical protein
MTVSRYTIKNPMFFYQQIKNKEVVETDHEDDLIRMLAVLEILINEEKLELAALLSSLSATLRQFALNKLPFASYMLDIYEKDYIDRKTKLGAEAQKALGVSRYRNKEYGHGSAILYGLTAMLAIAIILSLASLYDQLTQKKSMTTLACALTSASLNCHLEKAMMKNPEVLFSNLLQYLAIGLVVGLPLSYVFKIMLGYSFNHNHGIYQNYNTLFSKSTNHEVAVQVVQTREEKLSEDFVKLVEIEDQYHGRSIAALMTL